MIGFLEKPYGLALAFAGMFLCLWIFPIANHSEAEDAYTYAWESENFSYYDLATIYSSHRLYHPLAKAIFELSGRDRSFDVLCWFSRIVSAAALILFFWLLRQLGVESRTRAFLLTCLFSAVYGIWRYSSEVEVYALSWLATLGCISLTYVGFKKGIRPLLFGLAGVAASLIHFGITVPIAVFFGIYLLRKDGFKSAAVCALVFCGGQFSLNKAFETLLPRTRDAISEVRGFDPANPVDVKWVPYQIIKPSAIPKAGIGLGASVVGVAPVMGFDSLYAFLSEKVFPYRHLEEERFLVGDLSLLQKVIWPLGLLLLAVVSLLWIRHLLSSPKITWAELKQDPRVAALLAASLAYAAMIVVFEPENPEMWVMGLPCFALLAGAMSSRIPTRLIMTTLLAMAATNYVGGIGLLSDSSRDWNRVLSASVLEQGKPGDIWLVSDFNSNRCRLVVYESGVISRLFPSSHDGFENMLREMEEERQSGKVVFVDQRLIDHPLIVEMSDRANMPPEEYVLHNIGQWSQSASE